MINFVDPDHLAKVMKFAVENGCADKLLDKLSYLATYGEGDNACVVGYDWAPNSFSFAMRRPDGSTWFNGGLIYSGPTQPLDGTGPALTVGIGIDSSVHGWSVHS